jgi:hypothetical protein
MEWFIDEPKHGQMALGLGVVAIAIAGIWLGRRRLGFSVPVALVFLVVAAMAIPSAIPARPRAQRDACVNALRMIRNAKVDWANANGKVAGETPKEHDLWSTNSSLRHWPTCPGGGIYTIGALNHSPTCSLSNRGHRLE